MAMYSFKATMHGKAGCFEDALMEHRKAKVLNSLQLRRYQRFLEVAE
jgi:hypothetical protein